MLLALALLAFPFGSAPAQDAAATARWLAAPVAEVRAAAEKGEATAQYALGERLLRGRDGNAELAEAYRWTEMAAAQGQVEAQLRLGARYEQGIGCAVDLTLAREWFERAVEKGEAAAMLALARVRSAVIVGKEVDFTAALDWFRKTSATGMREGHWHLAKALKTGAASSPALAAERRKPLEVLALAGDVAAQVEMGNLHVEGTFVRPVVTETALYWYQLALRNGGGGNAERRYVSMALKNLPLEKVAEVEKRVAAFQPAPVKGMSAGAQSALHLDGPRPPGCAAAGSVTQFAQTRQQAEGGNAAAQLQLALAFHHSDGWDDAGHNQLGGVTIVNGRVARISPRPPPKHLEAAARWYRAAVSNGLATAGTQLGYLAVNGQLTDGDLAFAVAGVQRQSAAGDLAAHYQLANLHLASRGVPKNLSEAVRLLTLAAEGKNRDAMYQLAMLHHAGALVPVNLGESARWMRLAAQAGQPLAARQLRDLFGQAVPSAAKSATPIGSTPAVTKAARLALVPVGDSLRPVADLLTASFSALPDVTLLERAEIERVVREQSLAATLGRDPLKLGQLLGADGVLLLETNAVGEVTMAEARLVAVGPGVVLGEWLAPFPVQDAVGWSARVTKDAAPQLRKLAVPRAQATPISLLGLRMVVNVPDMLAVQQGLSRLFAHRLTQEREIFVLERQRIERLGTEKAFSPEMETPFWSGSHLLDGTIEPDLNAPGALTVRLQLASPGAVPLTLSATGARTNLAALTDTLVGKVLVALRKIPSVQWQPEAEAQRFWEEAAWARRWGQWRAAAAAMESAWALGLRGSNHAAFRMEVLLGGVQPGRLRWPGSGELPALLRQPPDLENLEFALRALDALHDQLANRSPAERAAQPAWAAYGTVALVFAGRVLEEYYHAPEHRRDARDGLEALRAQARSASALLHTIAAMTNGSARWEAISYGFRQDVLGRSPLGYVSEHIRLDAFEASWDPYWRSEPLDLPTEHRRRLRQPEFAEQRWRFITTASSRQVAWTAGERQVLRAKWRAHLAALAGSSDAVEQLEGLACLLIPPDGSSHIGLEPDTEEAMAIRRLSEAAWQQREALFTGRLAPHTWHHLRALCLARLRLTAENHDLDKVPAFFKPLDDRLRDYAATLGTARAVEFLRTAPAPDITRFIELVALPNFNATQRAELLLEARRHQERLRANGLEPLLARIESVAGSNVAAAIPASPSMPTKVTVLPTPLPGPAVPSPGSPAADALRVTRFWIAPEFRKSAGDVVGYPLPTGHLVESRHAEVHEWLWAEDRVWVAWRHDMKVFLPGQGFVFQASSHLAGYSLPDFVGDTSPDSLPPAVELPALFHPAPSLPQGRFAVVGGQAFASASNAVWRINKGAVGPLKLELSGQPLLAGVHGRLIIGAKDELYAYDVKTGTTELLASGRRRPATSPADGFVLGLGQAVALPGQRMRMSFTGSAGCYDYDLGSRQWTTIASPVALARRSVGEAWTATTYGNNYALMHLLPNSGTNWQLAALRLPAPPQDLSFFVTMTMSTLPGVPRWLPADRSLTPAGLAATSFSNRFWTITGLEFHLGHTNQDTFMLSTNGCHVRLSAWRADLTQPATVPLWLELPTGSLSRLSVGLARSRSYVGKFAMSPGALLATPPGLVYRAEAVPGFWFIPWSEVLPQVEAQFTRLAAVRDARPIPPEKHRGKQLLYIYDLDYDGKVTGGEFAALFSGEKLDSDSNASRMIFMHFNNADKNRDGGLDGTELSTIGDLIRARSVPSSVQLPPLGFGGPRPGPRPPGVPGQPFRPGPPGMQPSDLAAFDKNQDGRIDEEEAKALQQHLQAQQMRLPQQLPQGPPPPEILERYDKNKNGKMDPDEMQEFMREMMSGKSPRPRGTNAPPAVPTPASKAAPAKP